jgi:hypothetical protein
MAISAQMLDRSDPRQRALLEPPQILMLRVWRTFISLLVEERPLPYREFEVSGGVRDQALRLVVVN